jgi:ABC-type Zn2+ transport system substrate-binding protein/surface adhesin
MKIFNWIGSSFSSFIGGFKFADNSINHTRNIHGTDINPASSLPMNGSVDIHGNPFGTSNVASHDHHTHDVNHSSVHDHISSLNEYHNHHNFNDALSSHNTHDPFNTF